MAVDQYGASTSQEDSVTVGTKHSYLVTCASGYSPEEMNSSRTSAGEDIDLDNLQFLTNGLMFPTEFYWQNRFNIQSMIQPDLIV